MPELALATGTTGFRLSFATHALIHLDETNLRWLRAMLRTARQMAQDNPGFIGLRFAFPDGFFFEDPALPNGRGPYDQLLQRFKARVAIVVRRREIPNSSIVAAHNEVLIKNGSFSWEAPFQANLKSSPVSEGVVAQAWCLLCPENERTDAFVDLIQLAPQQALDWLEAGAMRSCDDSLEIPLPALSPESLVPLLVHPRHAIRERALTVLATYPGLSVRPPRMIR